MTAPSLQGAMLNVCDNLALEADGLAARRGVRLKEVGPGDGMIFDLLSFMKIQFIPSRIHGFLDYITGAALMATPRILGWSDRARHLHDAAAAATTSLSLATNYELGLVRKIPMRGHLIADVAVGAVLLLEGIVTPRRNQDERRGLMAFGSWYLLAAACSKPVSGTEKDQQRRWKLEHERENLPIEQYARAERPSAASS